MREQFFDGEDYALAGVERSVGVTRIDGRAARVEDVKR